MVVRGVPVIVAAGRDRVRVVEGGVDVSVAGMDDVAVGMGGSVWEEVGVTTLLVRYEGDIDCVRYVLDGVAVSVMHSRVINTFPRVVFTEKQTSCWVTQTSWVEMRGVMVLVMLSK